MKKMKAKRKYDFKGVREGEREREREQNNQSPRWRIVKILSPL